MSEELLAEIKDLRRRVAALEAQVFRRHRVSSAVREIISDWPGLFTAQQIEAALLDKHPDMGGELKPHHVQSLIARWEKDGLIGRETNGKGCVATIFILLKPFRKGVQQGEARNGRTAAYESGFRSIVRKALADADFPEPFKLEDLKAWMAKNLPDVEVPYGSWSSTLYKLQQANELRVIEARSKHSSIKRKVYGRGPVRVAPSGEELKEMESSWKHFRDSLHIQPLPEVYETTAMRSADDQEEAV